MKNLNCIIALLSFAMVSVISAMEMESSRWFSVVNNRKIERFVGGTINYDDEYKAILHHNDTSHVTLFPIERTDPLPIVYCGDQRVFITSAIGSSHQVTPGKAFTIIDPAIKQVMVVRGKVKSHDNPNYVYPIHLYLGLKTDNSVLLNEAREKYYRAEVMVFDENKRVDTDICHFKAYDMSVVEVFDGMLLMEEFKKKFSEIEICAQTSHLLRPLVDELLGKKRSQQFDCRTLEFDCTKKYWTKKKNKLKGIVYSSEDTK